jgi:alanine racemase
MTRPSDPVPADDSAPRPPRGLLREARLSRTALNANLSALLAARGASDAVADVRADAYGHGLSAVVAAAAEHGIRRFRVSPGITLTAGLEEETAPGDAEPELAVYGFAPTLDRAGLSPVLTLVGEVVSVKRVPAGSAISYGYTYRTDEESTLALVGLGYADGVPRLGSNRAHAVIGGEPALVAGRIAMDQFVLDLGRRDATVGDEVTVWGDTPAAREWAALSGRAAQSLSAGLGWRVARSWIEGASA